MRAEIAELYAAATKATEESTRSVQKQTEEARRITDEALENAEQIKIEAANTAEATVAAANRQSAMMKDRLEEQYSWRKEQLQRETNALQLRKDTLVAQLADIRELGEEAAEDFADADGAEPPVDVALPEGGDDRDDEDAEDTREVHIADNEEWLKEAPPEDAGAAADEPTALINTEEVVAAPAAQQHGRKRR